MILEQLKNGSQGACKFVADVGSQDKMAGYDTPGSRVPDWLLDDRDLPEGPGQRAKLRPDILMITPAEQGMPIDGPRKVTLLEVGYCSDTRYKEKHAEKLQQHQTLKQLLVCQRAQGEGGSHHTRQYGLNIQEQRARDHVSGREPH